LPVSGSGGTCSLLLVATTSDTAGVNVPFCIGVTKQRLASRHCDYWRPLTVACQLTIGSSNVYRRRIKWVEAMTNTAAGAAALPDCPILFSMMQSASCSYAYRE
jgi:hypothetical protein